MIRQAYRLGNGASVERLEKARRRRQIAAGSLKAENGLVAS
jgi:hypothetical protein